MDPEQACEVCGMTATDAKEAYGHPLIMSEKLAEWMCADCLRTNDPDCAEENGVED